MVIATAIFYCLMFAIAWFWLGIEESEGIFLTGLRDGLPLGLAVGVAAAALVVAASRFGHKRFQWARALEDEFRSILGKRGGAEVLALALFSGVAEEAFFRGAMQEAWGLVPTSLIFGGIHFVPRRVYLPWTLFAIVVGFLMGGIYMATRNIYAPIAAHVLINALNLWKICGPGAPPTLLHPSEIPFPMTSEMEIPPAAPPPLGDSAPPEPHP
ncbi:MAG: CPBP family intramembrane metalloprotease [Planctomycetota bacterium]|nr:CPBP family intramembrane metalloprotease [Planctomycetota bacterium]